MNRLKIIATTFSIISFCFAMVLFSACKKSDISYNSTTNLHPCDNVVCLNGGTCNDGQCNCAQGYEGSNCQIKWSDKFLGNYQASDECYINSSSPYYTVGITADADYAYKLKIYNIGTFCTGNIIKATINPEKTSFTIPMQNACGNLYISGTGNILMQDINVYLIARDSVAHTTNACSILLHKL